MHISYETVAEGILFSGSEGTKLYSDEPELLKYALNQL